jgi:hypothetical protein
MPGPSIQRGFTWNKEFFDVLRDLFVGVFERLFCGANPKLPLIPRPDFSLCLLCLQASDRKF